MKSKFDVTLIRIAAGIAVYFAMLALVSISIHALVAGPERFGVVETWPLAFYFVVAYVATLLVALGVIAVVRQGPGLMRRVFF